MLDDGAGETVTAQMPSAGIRLIEGGQVMLYTCTREAPSADSLVCVPDVEGLPIAEAAALLRQRGLEMHIQGTGYAVRQQPAAGSFITQDETVTVTFELPNP